MAEVQFYFSFTSPYAYLAHTQVAQIAVETGARIDYQPIDLKALWEMVGNEPQTRKCPPRMVFVIADLRRWVDRYQITMEPNPKALEFDSRRLLGGVFAAAAQGKRQSYIDAIFDAVWAHPRDLTSQGVWSARAGPESGWGCEGEDTGPDDLQADLVAFVASGDEIEIPGQHNQSRNRQVQNIGEAPEDKADDVDRSDGGIDRGPEDGRFQVVP